MGSQEAYYSPAARNATSSSSSALPAAQTVSRTRNIGIIAHIDAGKTTTTERMLYYSGFTRRLGDVDDGSTVTDFLPAERARGITIQSAAVTFHWPPLPADGSSTPEASSPQQLASSTSHTVNLIDTPGHADFTFEVLRSLRILDGAVCILDGVAGVEAQTEKVWHQASAYAIPTVIYVNKLDREGAAFAKTVREIASRLLVYPAVCQIPWWEGGSGRFVGVGDVIWLRGLRWQDGGDGKTIASHTITEMDQVEPTLASEMRQARVAMIELLSEHDDEMVEKYLEHDEDHLSIPGQDIIASLRRCLLLHPGTVIPVFAGASFKNIGVQPLLDAVIDLLPDPTGRPDSDISIGSEKGSLENLLNGKMIVDQSVQDPKSSRSKSVSTAARRGTSLIQGLEGCALAFKVVNDIRRGVLIYVRVYSGVINRNASLYNTNLNISERAPRLLRMYASDAIEIPSIPAGQIGVIVGLKHARTGDTLISYPGVNPKSGPPAPLNTLQLRPIDVPPPVFFRSVEAASLSEGKHLSECLALLLREDPSLHLSVDEDSGQTLLSGMGELHLEIARDRLINDFKAKAEMGQIEIGFRETVLGDASPHRYLFEKEIAGKKGKAGCEASVVPLTPHDHDAETKHERLDHASHSLLRDGNLITVHIPSLSPTGQPLSPDDPSLPSHLALHDIFTALTNGATAAFARGPTHNFPLHSVHLTLSLSPSRDIFGTDTTLAALTSAARLAAQHILRQSASEDHRGGSALMEPVMSVAITVDEASLGGVVHDLSASRGGHVLSLDESETSSALSNNSASSQPLTIDPRKIYAPPDPFESLSSSSDSHLAPSLNRTRTITARVPLKEMVGYLKHLRSLTGGRGTFVMSVDRFERMGRQRERVVLGEMRGGY
ncbi:MAG: Ribosome-releasing factor 2, mitochondrial [Caeruleum heppii]|nr:MAG: Ribosome-releasing factor 2, mitochondrial [Caeruleum heppii]